MTRIGRGTARRTVLIVAIAVGLLAMTLGAGTAAAQTDGIEQVSNESDETTEVVEDDSNNEVDEQEDAEVDEETEEITAPDDLPIDDTVAPEVPEIEEPEVEEPEVEEPEVEEPNVTVPDLNSSELL
ncbi:hypothetical protein [Halosolutus gelatinilyticus]|uniref:hypothetical protein n=1 Tax=Halosolutus gelatinilyticus TaxID=2931975 RepID=UPI001FF6C1B0|nr:hypothetical protein [Halosolutus gelatinilyticus]